MVKMSKVKRLKSHWLEAIIPKALSYLKTGFSKSQLYTA